MNERQKNTEHRKDRRGRQQNSPRPHEPAEEDSEWADEHQPDVEGRTDPCALVVTEPQVALQVGKAERDHSARESDNPRAGNDTEDSKQWTLGKGARHGSGNSACELRRTGLRQGYRGSRHATLRSAAGPDGGDDGKSGAQAVRKARILEGYFHGNPLHDLGEIPSRVIGRYECKLRAAGRR